MVDQAWTIISENSVKRSFPLLRFLKYTGTKFKICDMVKQRKSSGHCLA